MKRMPSFFVGFWVASAVWALPAATSHMNGYLWSAGFTALALIRLVLERSHFKSTPQNTTDIAT